MSSSLATRTILKKAEIVDIQRFQLFSFLLFLLFGHYLDIIREKTGFFALFQAVLQTKRGHCTSFCAMSFLFIHLLFCLRKELKYSLKLFLRLLRLPLRILRHRYAKFFDKHNTALRAIYETYWIVLLAFLRGHSMWGKPPPGNKILLLKTKFLLTFSCR